MYFAVEGAYAEITDRIQLNSASGLMQMENLRPFKQDLPMSFDIHVLYIIKRKDSSKNI